MVLSRKRAVSLGVLALALVVGLAAYRLGHRPPPPPPPPTPSSLRVFAAEFTDLAGAVSVKAVGKVDWVDARLDTPLRRGDMVRTGPNGSAEIRFFDGTTVRARPDSLVTVEETSEHPFTRSRRVAWQVKSGEVNFQTAAKNVPWSATEVSTPTVRATAGELSVAAVKVAQTGESEVRVFQGSGQVETRRGERVVLLANEGVRVDARGEAGSKRALPGTPVLTAPPHDAEFDYPEPDEATTVLAWDPVPGASAYRVMLDLDRAFNHPLLDREDVLAISTELRGLKGGEYFWRVAARLKDGSEGRFSEPARFTVIAPDAATAPPRLTVSLEVRQNVVKVKGRTAPGARVTVNDIPIAVAPDGGFAEFLTLERPGEQVVVIRSRGRNDAVAEQRQAITATF